MWWFQLLLQLRLVGFVWTATAFSLSDRGFSDEAKLAFSSLPRRFSSSTRYYSLNLSHGIVSPDGVPVTMMLVNGQLDYPIVAVKGDTLIITVANSLNVSTSLEQRDSPWMDGATMVTQCPIMPGQSFIYKFTLADQVGTYWYHSHSQLQSANGLRGPFIIMDDNNDPYKDDYDEELIMTLMPMTQLRIPGL
ncbi:hypothetical protein HK100_002013 [Physocladia obscura]|uniref:Plastocyanin-like domain-containing protein n=1 Tax=Physocladia obscura TaxID=109957 RepID=A0AAD5XFQ9_9FUNG|nr:hypothetical protein HK100_002013 [Physocladia obscura]